MKTKEQIEQLAEKDFNDRQECGHYELADLKSRDYYYDGFINGYNQCQEDMDWELLVKMANRYTEEDLHTILRLRKQWYSHTDKNVVRDFIKSKNKED